MNTARILKILAFAGVLAACVILAIIGLATQRYELLALLPFGLFGGISGFIYGTGGNPTMEEDPPGPGGELTGLPDWVTIVDFILLALGIGVIILVRVVG